jgi:hypothetical protein
MSYTEQLDQPEPAPAYCPFCGGPEPCDKRACLAALEAEADYWEGVIRGDA